MLFLVLSLSKFKFNPLTFVFEKSPPHHRLFLLKSLKLKESDYAKNLIKWITKIQNFDGSFPWDFFPGEESDPWMAIDTLDLLPDKQYFEVVRKTLNFLENSLEKLDFYSVLLLTFVLKRSGKVNTKIYQKSLKILEMRLKERSKQKKKLKMFAKILLNNILGDEEFERPSINEVLAEKDPWTLGYWLLTLKNDISPSLKQKIEDFALKTEKNGGGWRGRFFGFSGTYGDPLTTSIFLQGLIESKILDLNELSSEVKRRLELFSKIGDTLRRKERKIENFFSARIEDAGYVPNMDVKEKLLLCFIYSLISQFYWAISGLEPWEETLNFIEKQKGLVSFEKYTNFSDVYNAFKDILRGSVPSNRIEMVARAVTLYSIFLNSRDFESFQEYAENLRHFVIDEVSRYAPSHGGARNVGWVVRSVAFNRKELHNLVGDVYKCLMSLPSIGFKTACLQMFLSGRIMNTWNEEVRRYIYPLIDVFSVSTLSRLNLLSLPHIVEKEPRKGFRCLFWLGVAVKPNDPSLATGLWLIGREWCLRQQCNKYSDYLGEKGCWFRSFCPSVKGVERKDVKRKG